MIAQAPEWLVEELRSRKREENVFNFATGETLDGVPEGRRDAALWALACKLRSADVPEEAALALVLEAASNCTPPFDSDVAREKVRRAYATHDATVELTDAGNATYFASLYGDDVRYTMRGGSG